jgi:formylglycine-generating enzyme required for sulfatase activity
LPIVNVSWSEAVAYAEWLSGVTGARYRLPTEAEWEYAARGGATTTYPFGDELLPTHARFSFRQTEERPLAANDRSINRNDFRLYHMLGNVREWVADAWSDHYAGAPADGRAAPGGAGERVVRGGSYADGADALRVAARVRLGAAGDRYTGFRLLRELD